MLVQEFLQDSQADNGNSEAIVSGQKRLTYGDLFLNAQAIASWLAAADLRKGDRVAILTDDPEHYIASYFGVLLAGGIVVGLNTQTSERSLAAAIDDCTPGIVLTSGRCGKYGPLLSTLPAVNQTADIPSLLAGSTGSEKLVFTHGQTITPEDVAQIIYTSGTTGKPKGVMLTHANLVANTLATVEYLRLTKNDSAMAVLPFFYSYGNSILLTHMAVAGKLVVNQSFVYPNVILDQMVNERVTGLSGVPSTFALLLHRSNVREYSFPGLRYLTQAGAPMAPKLARQLQEIFPGVEIYIMYGQTEAAPRLSYLPPEYITTKPGSIGIAIPGVSLEILREDGSPAPSPEVGEIVAAGANVMAGYWNRPQETAEVLRDGKLWTGDLAYCDSEGFFHIVSRKSEMIKSGSHRIAPKEIEEIILEIEGVAEAAVTGVADEILGESIQAYIVEQNNAALNKKDIIRYCRRNLPAFKVPHGITFMEELPKSGTGKIKKDTLKSWTT